MALEPTLETRLTELGLNAEQIGKLVTEGVTSEVDLQLLSADDIRSVTGCGLVTARKVAATFAPATVSVPTVGVTASPPPIDSEIPDGRSPSPDQVTGFASSLGIDPSTLMLFMAGGMAGNSGIGMDLSGMIPVEQIVAGYNPKVRNMFLMIMGQVEARLRTPVIVINSDGAINRPLTVEYIMGLEEGRDIAENNIYFDGEGQPHEVIAVGVDAQSIYDADPLDSTRALQVNGMGMGRVSWKGVNDEVRQTAYYAVRTGEIDPVNDAHLSWLRDHIQPTSNRLVFNGIAPKAIGAFNDARRTGSLPNLRVMINRSPRRPEVMPRRRPGTSRELAGLGRDGQDFEKV